MFVCKFKIRGGKRSQSRSSNKFVLLLLSSLQWFVYVSKNQSKQPTLVRRVQTT